MLRVVGFGAFNGEVAAVVLFLERAQDRRPVGHAATERHARAAATRDVANAVGRVYVKDVPPKLRNDVERRMVVDQQISRVQIHSQAADWQRIDYAARSASLSSLPVSAASSAPVCWPCRPRS